MLFSLLWHLLGETFLWRVGVHHIVHVRRFEFKPMVKKLLDVKEVLLVVVAGQLVVGVLGQIILVRQKRPDAAQLQDTLAAVHDCQFIAAHKFFATMSSDELVFCFHYIILSILHIIVFVTPCDFFIRML